MEILPSTITKSVEILFKNKDKIITSCLNEMLSSSVCFGLCSVKLPDMGNGRPTRSPTQPHSCSSTFISLNTRNYKRDFISKLGSPFQRSLKTTCPKCSTLAWRQANTDISISFVSLQAFHKMGFTSTDFPAVWENNVELLELASMLIWLEKRVNSVIDLENSDSTVPWFSASLCPI